MHQEHARRGSPDHFGFEGSGDEARVWLDTAYSTNLRLTGPLGGVKHERSDHGPVVFDHIRIDATYTFDSDPMPVLVVVDVLRGAAEFVRDGVTDRVQDGDSVLVSGWQMPFAGAAASSCCGEVASGSIELISSTVARQRAPASGECGT